MSLILSKNYDDSRAKKLWPCLWPRVWANTFFRPSQSVQFMKAGTMSAGFTNIFLGFK